MTTSDLNTNLLVDQSPEEVFKAILNVRGWWSESIEGHSEKLNDVFTYKYKEMHASTQKLIEVIENEKVVWEVLDSYLSFIEDKNEWDGTRVSFEISKHGNQTKLQFIHHGIVPESECFGACTGGWNYYIHESLLPLIQTGKGQPAWNEN